MPTSMKKYDFNTRHGGRIVSDRECAIAETSRVLSAHQTMALDSAANVFRAALSALGVDHLALDDDALPAMFRVASRVGVVNGAGTISRPMAMDAAAHSDFAKRWPEAARVKFV
jgi:hypothetical protein